MPGCGAHVPRRERRTRTGSKRAQIALQPTRGLAPTPARALWGERPGERRWERGCRRGDAAAGWGCERERGLNAARPAPPSLRASEAAPRVSQRRLGTRASGAAGPGPARGR